MVAPSLTRRQQEIYDYLHQHLADYPHPPTLDELCDALGLKSRGSLHKQIQALIEAGLVEPMNNLRRGIRLTRATPDAVADSDALPLYGYIAAGRPIEAIANPETIEVPVQLRTANPCYVLEVRGDSMIDDGILDGDWVVIEHREQARNGEIVVALIDGEEATLKRLEQRSKEIVLHPANSALAAMHFSPERIRIKGCWSVRCDAIIETWTCLIGALQSLGRRLRPSGVAGGSRVARGQSPSLGHWLRDPPCKA